MSDFAKVVRVWAEVALIVLVLNLWLRLESAKDFYTDPLYCTVIEQHP